MNLLEKILFEEECERLEKALEESENDRINNEDYEDSVRTIVLLNDFDKERVQNILKRVIITKPQTFVGAENSEKPN